METNINKKVNYDLIMNNEVQKIVLGTKKPTLLLHSCCGPCSSAVLKRIMDYFDITVIYYNPNIYPKEEYDKREIELKKLIDILNDEYTLKAQNGEFKDPIFHQTPILYIAGSYEPQKYYDSVKGYEKDNEGGQRCYLCYNQRLSYTAQAASKQKFDYFCTTLTVSPYKNAEWINEIGEVLSKEYNIPFLNSDFKKQNGYQKSIEYSKQYGLYRQDYCGCEYSLNANTLKKG